MANPRYSIMPARAVFDARLSSTDIRVLAALGSHSDGDGWCFPSQRTLTERLNLARSTLCSSIARLSALGYVEVRARTAKGRGKTGNEYRVKTDLPPMSDQSDIGAQVVETAPMSDRKDNGADVRPTGHPMSDQSDIGIYSLTTPMNDPKESPSNEGSVGGAKKSAKPGAKYTPEFEAIWRLWPAHRRANSDKRTAFRRYQSGVSDFGADSIHKAAKAYLARPETRKENFRYCCLVEVFMNGKLEAAVEAVNGGKTGRQVWSAERQAYVDESDYRPTDRP